MSMGGFANTLGSPVTLTIGGGGSGGSTVVGTVSSYATTTGVGSQSSTSMSIEVNSAFVPPATSNNITIQPSGVYVGGTSQFNSFGNITYVNPTSTTYTTFPTGIYITQAPVTGDYPKSPEKPPEPKTPDLKAAMENPVIDQLIKSVREAKILLDTVDDNSVAVDVSRIRQARQTIEEALDTVDKIEQGLFE